MHKITLEKINDITVKPIPDILIGGGEKKQFKGHKLFGSNGYCNVFLCAKKRSGKTHTIYNIIQKCASSKSNVIAFSSSVNKDKSYLAIKKYCKLKDIPFVGYTDFIDENGVNILKNIIDNLKNEEPEDEELDERKHKQPFDMYGNINEEHEKEKKEKYLVPEYIFIFDDLSTGLQNPMISKLVKMNRHFKAMVLLSSQYLKDLQPQALRQMDFYLVFSGQSEDKLRLIHQHADLSVEYEDFEKIYHHATSEKYNFLFIDTAENELRKNFNLKYNIN